MSLLDLLLTIRDAGEDPRVAGLVVRIRPLDIGWAKAQDIRDALLTSSRASGKPLHAYLELELSGGSMEYYIASAADTCTCRPARPRRSPACSPSSSSSAASGRSSTSTCRW